MSSEEEEEGLQKELMKVIRGLPDGYHLKPALIAIGAFANEEWLKKFSPAGTHLTAFAAKLAVREAHWQESLLAVIPKLPDLTFPLLLEASDVLKVARDTCQQKPQSWKEKQAFHALTQDLESMILDGVHASRSYLGAVLRKTTSLRYRSVLMDIHDVFNEMLDDACALSVYDGTEPLVQTCDRRSVYAVLGTLLDTKKWPLPDQTPQHLYFSALRSLEELAGDVLTGKNLEPWLQSITKLTEEKKEDERKVLSMVPEVWMHRLRMLKLGLEDAEFGAVDPYPWYRSTPFVLVACLLTFFFFALFSTILYYIFYHN